MVVLLEVGAGSTLFLVSDSFQLGFSFSDLGMKAVQLIAWVIYTVGTVQYFSINTAWPYIAHTAITKLYITDCQATITIDIFSLEVMFKLLTPCFSNLSPGSIIVLLCCFVRRAFGADKTAVRYHRFSHSGTD